MTPKVFVERVHETISDWKYERVSIGYPGDIVNGHPAKDPYNLGGGGVGYDYAKAFGMPTRIINDAVMQALGSYEGGKMLYLGFGTGIGTALIIDGLPVPLALGHLPLRAGQTYNQILS